MRGESSGSAPSLMQKRTAAGEAEEPNGNAGRELQCLATSPFRLPDDWFVELKPRGCNPGHVDKYYHETSTGRKFRSLIAVQRYLKAEKQDAPILETVKAGNENTEQFLGVAFAVNLERFYHEPKMQLISPTIRSTSPFKLPDDWVIEERPRRNINYTGVIDKHYIEQGTGLRFRSLIAVQRYLTEANRSTATPKNSSNSGSRNNKNSSYSYSARVVRRDRLERGEDTIALKELKLSSCSTPSKRSASRKKNIFSKGVNMSMLGCASPPAKINWVLCGPRGDLWSAFMDKSVVPESVLQKWSDAFIITMHGINSKPPGF